MCPRADSAIPCLLVLGSALTLSAQRTAETEWRATGRGWQAGRLTSPGARVASKRAAPTDPLAISFPAEGGPAQNCLVCRVFYSGISSDCASAPARFALPE
jgi:hypothetical protein